MFEKYNEKARRALFFARYESSKLRSKVIESEHILLGILREGEDVIKEIFSRFNVRPDDIRREIEGNRVFVERVSSTQELPLSEESKKIRAYASHEAESMMPPYVGTEHLLIGILRVDPCVASRILVSHGFNLYGVREETMFCPFRAGPVPGCAGYGRAHRECSGSIIIVRKGGTIMVQRYGVHFAVLAVACLMIGCSTQDSKVIRIGAAGPMTGDQSKMGIDLRNGAELAVMEWNEKGGVLGKKIELIAGDDQADPKQAVSVRKQIREPEGCRGSWTLELELLHQRVVVL